MSEFNTESKSVRLHMNKILNELRILRDSLHPMNNDSYEEITDAIECVKAAVVWSQVTPSNKEGVPAPIHKFNGGVGATLCTECRVIITEGFTDDTYCQKCASK